MGRRHNLSLRDQMRLSNRAHEQFTSNRTVILWTVFVILPPALGAFLLMKPIMNWLGYGASTSARGVATVVLVALFWPWSAWIFQLTRLRTRSNL